MSNEEQIIYDLCPKTLPEGHVRVWVNDGQGGGAWEVRTKEADANHCDHCDGEDDVQGPSHNRVCEDCRDDIAEMHEESLRERAMHAGMAFGCQGYNDAMGY